MSSAINLDFQDYAPTNSGDPISEQQHQQQQQQQQPPNVQILIPTHGPSSASSNGTKRAGMLHNVTNFGNSQSSSSSAGLSEEALQQLIWLSTKQQRNRQQRESKTYGGNWCLNLLAPYFDVTTNDVIQRIVWSAIPIRKEGFHLDDSDLTEPLTNEILLNNSPSSENNNSRLSERFGAKQKRLSYMERFIQSRPDFYGPFWIGTTLIFAIAIFSNIVSSVRYQSRLDDIDHIRESLELTNRTKVGSAQIVSALGQTEEWHYSMKELNTASSLITFYVTLWPSFLWFLFWLQGCSKYYTLTETMCAYGYSLSIFIPMTALLIIQASAFRYLMISLAATLSGSVLVLSFLPVMSGSNLGGLYYIVLVMIFACQSGLAYILHRMMLE